MSDPLCPLYGHWLSQAGITLSAVLSALGAAFGTARSGIAICAIAPSKPEAIVKSLVPVVMAGILSIYGMVISIYISLIIDRPPVSLYAGALHFGGGLSVGLPCLAAGMAIGVVGDAGVRGYAKEPRLINGFIMLMVFAEILAVYGFICAIMMINRSKDYLTC